MKKVERVAPWAGILLVFLCASEGVAQPERFVVSGVASTSALEGSNDALGVSFTWKAPDPDVMAVVVTARVTFVAGAKLRSSSFTLRYQDGKDTQSRKCIALDVRASEREKLRLTSAASQTVEWTARRAGGHIVTLVFINVPVGTRQATLMRDDAVVADVQVPK